jgi:hypothetical protein
MHFLLHFIMYLENPARTLICGRGRKYAPRDKSRPKDLSVDTLHGGKQRMEKTFQKSCYTCGCCMSNSGIFKGDRVGRYTVTSLINQEIQIDNHTILPRHFSESKMLIYAHYNCMLGSIWSSLIENCRFVTLCMIQWLNLVLIFKSILPCLRGWTPARVRERIANDPQSGHAMTFLAKSCNCIYAICR